MQQSTATNHSEIMQWTCSRTMLQTILPFDSHYTTQSSKESTVSLRLRDTMGAKFLYQLQPPVATALLHSPSWKRHTMKPVILASIERAERKKTHVVVDLCRLPPLDYSRKKSDLARKIQRRHLQPLCIAATSSKWQKLFHLAFTVREKGGN